MAIKNDNNKTFDDINEIKEASQSELELLGFEVDTSDYVVEDLSNLEKITLNELDSGTEYDGKPSLFLFENDDKNWDNIRVRIIDEDDYLQAYCNIPKPDENGFITNIHQKNSFYRGAFDLIYSYLRAIDETLIVDPNSPTGYINHIKKININQVIEQLNKKSKVEVRVTEGSGDGYNSMVILEMED